MQTHSLLARPSRDGTLLTTDGVCCSSDGWQGLAYVRGSVLTGLVAHLGGGAAGVTVDIISTYQCVS